MRFAWVILLAGCGGACPREVAEHQALFEARAADDQLDGLVEVPFGLLDHLLAAELRQIKPVALSVPGLGTLSLVPTAVRLKPAPAGQLAFTFECAVQQGSRVLFSLTNEASVMPQVDAQKRRLSFSIGPESLRKVAPRLGPEASDSVARAVRAELPPALRMALTPKRLQGLTDRALAAVVDGAYALLRDGAAARLLPRTEVHLDLPDLPLDRIELRSMAGWLAVGLHLEGGGLPEELVPAIPPADRVRVRLSGGAVAGLANQAIAAGDLPGRYSQAGKPVADGPLQVGLGWGDHPRPMKVLVWQTEGTCVHARLGGTPEVQVQQRPAGRTIQVRVADGQVEAVEGSLLVEAGAWLTGVWDRTLRFTQTAVAETRLEVGGRPLVMALDRAVAGPQGLDFTLEIRR